MVWKNKRKKPTKYENYSIVNKLKSDGKLTTQTINNINNISLEDLIAIKLELATRYTCGKFYGMPVWRITRHTIIDALLKTGLKYSQEPRKKQQDFLVLIIWILIDI